ncbi:MAG: phage head closure protein [Candidatus Omnitrophica bacterium]|nr:phage head closure protein [Candidatus Omnitrophota bacterium]
MRWKPNTQISILRNTKVPDGMGGFTTTKTVIASQIWAQKTTHRSNEAVQAMAQTGISVHNFRIRYRTGIRSSDMILEGDKYMAMVGKPIEIERRRWLDITVKEAA